MRSSLLGSATSNARRHQPPVYEIPKGLWALTIASVVGMFLVLLMGALVTKTGSAEGCGSSWPLCDGEWLPAANMHSIIEYSHRAVSALVGLIILVWAVWAWRVYGNRKDMRVLIIGSVAFLIIQGALGAMAVVWPQPKTVLALHFGISLVAFACVLLPAIIMRQLANGGTGRTGPVSARLRFAIWAGAIYVYGLVYTGAYVRHTNSHLACLDWPLCNGALIPELSGPVGIQFAHRLAALGGLIAVAIIGHVAKLERKERPDIFRGAVIALILMGMQILGGAYVILSFLSMEAMMLHSAIVTALFGALSYLCLQTVAETPAEAAEEAALRRRAAVS